MKPSWDFFYAFVLRCHSSKSKLSEKIRFIQKDFADRFGSSKALKNFPHITIISPFKFDEINESEVIGNFQKEKISTEPFEIELKNSIIFIIKNLP